MTDDVDRNRRHFLTVATAVTGGAGLIAATIPFVASMKPSARAQALGAPVEVPIGTLEPGEMIRGPEDDDHDECMPSSRRRSSS